MKKPVNTVPPGPALNTPDDDLDMLALVTPEDIELAKADAARQMTKRGAALIDAARAERLEEEAINE